MNNKEKEALEYLKNKREFHSVLMGMKEKYIKLGKLSGKVNLKGLSKEESFELSAINEELYMKSEGEISIKKFIDYFTRGRFEGVDFTKVFLEFFGGELKTNKDKNLEEIESKKDYCDGLYSKIKDDRVRIWLFNLIEYKKYGYKLFIKEYKENKARLEEIIYKIDRGLEFLSFNSLDSIPLATFSTKVTRDSHYFDLNRVSGKLLLNFLAFTQDKNFNYSLDETNDILLNSGIIRDEVSNFTITAGLYCYNEEEEIQGLKWFRRNYEPLILNVHNLNSIKKICANNNCVFVFENPTPFYEILNELKELRPSLICVSGQPNTSTHIILEKLKESNIKIYYSGDFDPEGLIICDNLKTRYGEYLTLFSMDKELYLKGISEISFKDRINKLDGILSSELEELKEIMRENGLSAYQESYTNEYIKFIKDKIK